MTSVTAVTDSSDPCNQFARQRERAFSGTSCRQGNLRLWNGPLQFSPEGFPNFGGVLKDATRQSDIDLISGLPQPAKYQFRQASQFHAGPRQDVVSVRIARLGSGYYGWKHGSKIRQRSCVSAADEVVIRANAPMLQDAIAQFGVASGIERMGDCSHRLHTNPVSRTFVGDAVAPTAGARGAAGRVTAIGYGAGSR